MCHSMSSEPEQVCVQSRSVFVSIAREEDQYLRQATPNRIPTT